MKSIAISGTQRDTGSKVASQLRTEGKVPCVLYGGSENIHFAVPTADFKGLVYTPDVHTVDLSIDGKAFQAVLQEIQFHPVNDSILHVDFVELKSDKPVIIEVPVNITGNSVGVRAGGKLVVKARKLKVKALPAHLPDGIHVNIDTLDIGKSIRVKDIVIPNVEILNSANNVVTAVEMTRQAAAAEASAKK
jgi:large subunit ribosomal protein L25